MEYDNKRGLTMGKKLAIICAIIISIALTACNKTENKLDLPEAKDIKGVEIIDSKTKKKVIINSEIEISKIVDNLIHGSRGTRKESVNDAPTKVDSFITISFINKDSDKNQVSVHIYKKWWYMCYLERPYLGIWKIKKDVYNQFHSKLVAK